MVRRPAPLGRSWPSLLAIALLGLSIAVPSVVAAAGATVRVTDRLSSAVVTIAPGSTVTWVNASGERHRFRSTNHSGDADWDTGNLEPGERASIRFDRAGTFAYVDDRDRDETAYHGTVIVGGSGGAGSSPAAGGGNAGGSAGAGSGGGASAGGGSTGGPTRVTVGMAGRAFSPSTITVAAGSTVVWQNDDDDGHTVTATDQTFDSGIEPPGGSFARTFTTTGTFRYVCLIHSDMTGSVTVRAAATGTGDTQAPANAPAAAASPAVTPAPAVVGSTDNSADVAGQPAAPPAATPAATPGVTEALAPIVAPTPAAQVAGPDLGRWATVVALVVAAGLVFGRTIRGAVRRG